MQSRIFHLRAGIVLLSLFAVSLSAAAASWHRYPALSPDGSQIAFSSMGELWVVPSSGGEARALTRNPGLDTRPVWFPDGRRIAFASDRNANFDIYVTQAEGGTPERWSWHSAHDYPWVVTADNRVLFSSGRTDPSESRLFPARYLSEVYSLGAPDEAPRWEDMLQAEELHVSADGEVLYERVKAVEDQFRKHQTSSAARDIWLRHADGSHEQVTLDRTDDREAVWDPAGKGFYWLSEQDGCLNVWHRDSDGQERQLTTHSVHPVRSLSVSQDGSLCYSQAGELWLRPAGGESRRLDVMLPAERLAAIPETRIYSDEVTEAAQSPDGVEVAFIIRGEVYVSSVEHGSTRRITDTAQQERNLHFAPDGRSLYYAGERDGSWNIYRTIMPDSSDHHMYASVLLQEEDVLISDEDTFQPRVSPDGKELAFLARRTELRVMTLESGDTRVVVPERINYSYSDDDQWYRWSPDGSWFTLHYLTKSRWMDEVGLVPAAGGEIINLTESGYSDFVPRWSADGNTIYFLSDRKGMRSHGSWGSEDDIYAVFLNREAWENFKLSPEEYAVLHPEDEDWDDADESESDDSGGGFFGLFRKKAEENPDREQLLVEEQDIELRRARITKRSARVYDFQPSMDGEEIFLLARYGEDVELIRINPREHESEVILNLGHGWTSLLPQVEEGSLLLVQDGRLTKVDLFEDSPEPVPFTAEMTLRQGDEWEYAFEHIWRQVREKFYDPNLHGVDWDKMYHEYKKFLPAIDHKRDFANCMSEMLGELNASHTGCFVGSWRDGGDQTADLGLLFDPAWAGEGLLIEEILRTGPFDRSDSRVLPGMRIVSINQQELSGGNPWRFLNRLGGDPVAVGIHDPASGDVFIERVKPLSAGGLWRILYRRWTRKNSEDVAKRSAGRLGYVHVLGMDDASYRQMYHEALGRHADKEGLVVDSRHNGGGWLTDDLVTFLSGRRTFRSVVRPGERVIGEEPYKTWNRPSIVLMNESNYSDAHMFPFAYKDNQIGQLVGMPVAGTGTAVWWEGLMDGELVFGIPQVGMVDEQGQFLENLQLEPDIRVDNRPESVKAGRDEQLEAAVSALLKEIDAGE